MMKLGMGARVAPFQAMEVIARANRLAAALPAGAPPVLRMEIGQPGQGAPSRAVAAAAAALQGGHPLGYTEARGLLSLRERLAAHYRAWYGADVSPARILITTGASGAFPLAFLSAFAPGDRVAMASPYYPPYRNALVALGLVPVILPTDAGTRFQPDIAMLDALDPPPDGLLLASPGNPAGTMLAPAAFDAICRWCAANGVRPISDEIYHGLEHALPIATAARHDGAIVVSSFSKYFRMAGWRIGWMVLPEDLVRPAESLAQNLCISAPHLSQLAAAAAFDCHDELRASVAAYRRSRALLLPAMPGRVAPADGAFYLYADLGEGADGAATAGRLLRDAHIAATPGIDFDAERGGRFLRFGYCGAEADMAQAAARLRGFGWE